MSKQPAQIQRDEHEESINAKKVSLVSAATIYVMADFVSGEQIAIKGNVTVQAVNFDIRDLTSASDSVTADLNTGANYVGLATVDIGSIPPVAVSSLKGNVTISNSKAFIGLATVVLSKPNLGSNATFSNVTVINTATQIIASDTTRRSLLVQNISNSTVCVGTDNSVTLNNGIRLRLNDSVTLDKYDGAVWGIADATGQPVRFLAELD